MSIYGGREDNLVYYMLRNPIESGSQGKMKRSLIKCMHFEDGNHKNQSPARMMKFTDIYENI